MNASQQSRDTDDQEAPAFFSKLVDRYVRCVARRCPAVIITIGVKVHDGKHILVRYFVESQRSLGLEDSALPPALVSEKN
ncbi:hypothetical protein TNCV_2438751 [Trichonephila clavipes]|nr:hypothetical protein TNCV_2438751 [Trichonephila clavipes]